MKSSKRHVFLVSLIFLLKLIKSHKNRKMSPTIRHKYKYFHCTVQRTKDRQQKFHFCRLPFDVRPRNVKLNLSMKKNLSLGQTDRQVVASERKVNLRRDLRWVAKRVASFFASTRKSPKKDILRKTILYFIG